jgi:hypothetical protein
VYIHSDDECNNENTITQSEIDWVMNGIRLINKMKIRKNLI